MRLIQVQVRDRAIGKGELNERTTFRADAIGKMTPAKGHRDAYLGVLQVEAPGYPCPNDYEATGIGVLGWVK